MPVIEGVNSEAPQDAAGRRMLGLYREDNEYFYHFRGDGVNNLRVALWDGNGTPLLSSTNAGHVQQVGSNAILFDGSGTYTALDAIGTVVNVDVALTGALAGNGLYVVTIFNASTDSQISCSMQNVETFDSVTKYATVQSSLNPLVVPASSSRSWLIQGWLVGEAGRLVLTNATAIEATDAEVYVRIRRV